MTKKLFGIFDRRPLIWFHYLLLTLVLFGSYYFGNYLLQTKFTELWVMFLWFLGTLWIGDSIIHAIIGVD